MAPLAGGDPLFQYVNTVFGDSADSSGGLRGLRLAMVLWGLRLAMVLCVGEEKLDLCDHRRSESPAEMSQ